jgi:hypothetical protein
VWRDTADLWPGEDWRTKIRQAITHNSLVFIACFSSHSVSRSQSYQNEELMLAITQVRIRKLGEPWLIPVRFDDCAVPDLEINADRTLASIQRVDLFGEQRDAEIKRLLTTIRRLLRQQLHEQRAKRNTDSKPNEPLEVSASVGAALAGPVTATDLARHGGHRRPRRTTWTLVGGFALAMAVVAALV